ncbi:GumC family protein [Helicovermis profundi]|uniref:Polysaccharide chain length determinant N-terminal domain-containing protein n=1 Tax=Helicovermis profundi TaxID=3065157 RepID=A0AAU9EA26_9FIRM|nr:hypothetical protein HLPR_27040 [Clostridia bacterium S502]
METKQNYEYDEISLKELIETIIKGKKTIIVITSIVLILASIYTFAIQKPVYESKTVLLASNVASKVTKENITDITSYINNLSIQNSNTLETYKQQIKSPNVFENVIKTLKLDKEKYTVDSLSNIVRVNLIKDTNLIEISAKTTSANLSEQIANATSDSFINFINNINEKKVNQSVEFLKVKIEEQDAKLKTAMSKYEQFLKDNGSITSLKNAQANLYIDQKNIKTKFDNLESNYQDDILNNEINVKKSENKLESYKSVISSVDKTLKTNESIVNNDLLRESLSENGLSLKDLSGINLVTESYNANYLALTSQENQEKIKLKSFLEEKNLIIEKYKKEKTLLKNKLDALDKEINANEVKLSELMHTNDLLNNEITNAKKTYELLLNKYDEIKITESVKAGEVNIIVNSKAYTPNHPISPNKKLNLAIAFVLGLMISVFIVFFMAMWKSDSNKVK